MIFRCLSDRNNLSTPKPRVIPSYLSVEDLYYRSDCEVFFNFSLFGFQTWIKKYYSRYRLYTRGFHYDFKNGVSYASPYHDNFTDFSSFDVCLGYFYSCVQSLSEAVLRRELATPVNSFRHYSVSELARRSCFVGDVFKLSVPRLPFLVYQGELF